MTRTSSRFAAWLALAAFAFSQMAISAYACPKGIASSAQGEASVEYGGACPEVSSPNLCERHCDYGSASVGTHSDEPPAPDLALLHRGAIVATFDVAARHVPARFEVRSAAPPPPAHPTPLRI